MKSKKPTSVRLNPEQKQKLKQLSKLRKISQQTIVQEAIQLHLWPKKGAR